MPPNHPWRELELERHGYKVHPMGPVLPGVPRGWIADHLRGRTRRATHEQTRGSSRSATADAVCRSTTPWASEGHRPNVNGPALAHPGATEHRVEAPFRIWWTWPRLAWSQRGIHAAHQPPDVTRLLTMSIADLLDDWFESPPHPRGLMAVKRHHRNVGRTVRARHRIRHGPTTPSVTLATANSAGWDTRRAAWVGCVGGPSSRGRARSFRPPKSRTKTQRFPRVLTRGGQVRGVVPRQRGRTHRPIGGSPPCTRRSPSSTILSTERNCPTISSAIYEHWKTRSGGVVKINLLALAELPSLLPQTRVRGWPEHLTGSIEMARRWSTSKPRSRDAPPSASLRCCRSATVSSPTHARTRH